MVRNKCFLFLEINWKKKESGEFLAKKKEFVLFVLFSFKPGSWDFQ